jgi:hypothetical protein
MADTVSSHLSRKPKARGTTVEWLMKRDAKLAELRSEIERQRKRRRFLDWLWKDILHGDRWRA